MIIELRVYHCLPGRLPALNARFENTTLAFWEKYGIRQVGFFTTLVGALVGFKAADKASLDVISVYGGSRWIQLRKVRLIAALPAILSALQVAVPTAFLGAVLGEYMGATDRSVGIMMIRFQGNLDSVHVWAVLILIALVAMVGYAALGLVSRLVTPWMAGGTR